MLKREALGRSAILLEGYVFPFIFAYFAVRQALWVYHQQPLALDALHAFLGAHASIQQAALLSKTIMKIILFLFNITIVWALMVRRYLIEPPSGFAEIAIPILCTFWLMSFSFVNEYLPQLRSNPVVPTTWMPYLALAGFVVACAGFLISLTGLYYLRHSFGIVVQVREIITNGPYRLVRHPIYFGYIVKTLGLCLAQPRIVFLTQAFVFLDILILRAWLEERKLAESSPIYQKYMLSVGRLNPTKAILRSVKDRWSRANIR